MAQQKNDTNLERFIIVSGLKEAKYDVLSFRVPQHLYTLLIISYQNKEYTKATCLLPT